MPLSRMVLVFLSPARRKRDLGAAKRTRTLVFLLYQKGRAPASFRLKTARRGSAGMPQCSTNFGSARFGRRSPPSGSKRAENRGKPPSVASATTLGFGGPGAPQTGCAKVPAARASVDYHNALVAALTRSGVSGNSRRRAPVASATALAIAAAVGPCAASPVPRNGWPVLWLFWLIIPKNNSQDRVEGS